MGGHEYAALVVGPNDWLVICVPGDFEPSDVAGLSADVRRRVKHDRVLVLAGVE
jgi:hypothetical protein